MKLNKALTLYLTTIIIFSGLGYYELCKTKSETYFNIWFNQIIQKSQNGRLLIKRDMEYGIPVVTNYEISGRKIGLEEIFPIVRYDKKAKVIDIFLMLPGSELLGFNDLPKDLSKKICTDVEIAAIYNSPLIINGEEFDKIKDFVKFTKCNFLAVDKETDVLVPTGGWMFRTNSGNEQPTEITDK